MMEIIYVSKLFVKHCCMFVHVHEHLSQFMEEITVSRTSMNESRDFQDLIPSLCDAACYGLMPSIRLVRLDNGSCLHLVSLVVKSASKPDCWVL